MYHSAPDKNHTENAHTPGSPEIQFGKGLVLIVDDEESVISILKKMLDRLGYTVLAARSGKEAVDVYNIHKHAINLVILDLVMPGFDGDETYNQLKEIDENVNVLLSSGYDINNQITKILDRGCNGYIQKPFTIIDFSIKIKQMIDYAGDKIQY